MHFSIPDSQELYAETTGTTYTAYNVYINGSYHACLRYKQLHALHEQLRRHCINMGVNLPIFPPKKFLPLTNNQVETRRAALEHYLQLIGQNSRLAKLELIQQFLLRAQLETAALEGVLEEWFGYGTNEMQTVSEGNYLPSVTLEVMLPNGYQLPVNCRVSDNASTLLEKVAACLKLPTTLLPYFCLFLVRKEANNSLALLRKLMDFEAPFISRLQLQACQVLIRKSYWNPYYDLHLFDDAIALNILFMQTVADIEREWILVTPELMQQLISFKEHGMKREYVEVARRLPLYGCLQFMPSQIDYPDHETTAVIAIGNKELSMRTIKEDKIYETKFRVTRMRCWRVTATHNAHKFKDKPYNLQLSFEYLISKQNLRWITISSAQAMLMSVCLQSMVDELLTCKGNEQPTSNLHNSYMDYQVPTLNPVNEAISTPTASYGYHNNDDFSTITTLVSPISTPTSNHSTPTSTSSDPCNLLTTPVTFIAQRIINKQHPKLTRSQSYGAVLYRTISPESVQNIAFDASIGDDDL